MSRTRTVAAVSAAALMGAALLAGCSSSSDSAATTSAAASTAASAAASGSAQLPAPVIVEEGATEASCSVGNALDIVVPEAKLAGTTVASSDESIVTVTQGGKDGDALFNPGGTCVAAGTATITVTNPDSTKYDITVTVS